jgi:hypothetical protein
MTPISRPILVEFPLLKVPLPPVGQLSVALETEIPTPTILFANAVASDEGEVESWAYVHVENNMKHSKAMRKLKFFIMNKFLRS